VLALEALLAIANDLEPAASSGQSLSSSHQAKSSETECGRGERECGHGEDGDSKDSKNYNSQINSAGWWVLIDCGPVVVW